MENKIMLITYADSMGKNINELHGILNDFFADCVHSVHLLPFYPSSGDRGFSPIRYDVVDPAFGTWADVERLASDYPLMADFMINHISRRSDIFADFVQNKDASRYKDFFIRYKDFWKNGSPTPAETAAIYKRKDKEPYTTVRFADGSEEKLWCTFSEEQIDLNLKSETVWRYIKENFAVLVSHGVRAIRLDAVAYATKRAGSSCFFVEPEMYEIFHRCNDVLPDANVEILPEVHENAAYQKKVTAAGYPVYDFVLPVLLLYTLHEKNASKLVQWIRTCPRKQYTTLDTHDGLGIVDVRGILTEAEIDRTVNWMYGCGANMNRKYSTDEFNNLDVYQVNCTYYSALGQNDDAYLAARAVQFFTPGIPQVYYVGLLAGANDIDLVNRTRNGRDINRHYYTRDEIEREIKRPVVRKLQKLMRFRNTFDVFTGDMVANVRAYGKVCSVLWTKGEKKAELTVDFETLGVRVRYGTDGEMRSLFDET